MFFLIGLLIYIVIVPFTIYANTYEDRYYFLFPGLFRILVFRNEGGYAVRMRLFFISFRMNAEQQIWRFEKLVKRGARGDKINKKKRKKRFNMKKKFRAIYLFMLGILGTFKVKHFEATFDTGDYTLNALLVPVFSAINGEKHGISINFNDEFGLIAKINNRIFNFLRPGLMFYIRYKKSRIL